MSVACCKCGKCRHIRQCILHSKTYGIELHTYIYYMRTYMHKKKHRNADAPTHKHINPAPCGFNEAAVWEGQGPRPDGRGHASEDYGGA